MLPRKNRLKKKKDFERVFKKGRGFKEGFLYLKILENNLNLCRFGFAVGKNISPKAVIRNKIRRKLSESVRIKLSELKKNIDGVFVALPGAEYDFKKLEQWVNKIFQKAGIIK